MSFDHTERPEPAIERNTISRDGDSKLATEGHTASGHSAVEATVGVETLNALKPIEEEAPKIPTAKDTQSKWKVAVLLSLLLVCLFLVALDRSVIATV